MSPKKSPKQREEELKKELENARPDECCEDCNVEVQERDLTEFEEQLIEQISFYKKTVAHLEGKIDGLTYAIDAFSTNA